MPGTKRSGPSGRPETLREAKAKYRKSSGRPKLSAQELAYMERESILQERADKIKNKETKRKEAKKKREEKLEKDREAARKLGRALPREGGFKVGSSQLDLARFLPAVVKEIRKIPQLERCDQALEEEKKNREGAGDSVKEEQRPQVRTSFSMAPPPRPPLKSISSNTVKKMDAPISQSKRPHSYNDYSEFFVSNTQIERELSPPTAPLPSIPKPSSWNRPFTPKMAPAFTKVSSMMEERDDAAAFLAQISTQDLNFCPLTQVEKPLFAEITGPPSKLHQTASLHTVPSQILPTLSNANLLLDISTQDLDFGDLTQPEPTLSPLGPVEEDEMIKTDISVSFGLEDDISDGDLEALAEEVELQSSTSSLAHQTPTHAPLKTPARPHSMNADTPLNRPKETPLSELKLSRMDIAMMAMQGAFSEADDEPWDDSIPTDEDADGSFG
ncbi:uncharacterized protein KY384_001381 [Bacidia gigantensis]|uniref:uncharacterized protein n=1 Tax=Bacidia gigantensis TaxID=2732470 RepID=UPI001D03D474|nr:uncharacterized protein KY384_001381 [Bacidia gigantensis]KAG8533640.1 hypothetical protein KY384_001381 [Bacidia gigantensis]